MNTLARFVRIAVVCLALPSVLVGKGTSAPLLRNTKSARSSKLANVHHNHLRRAFIRPQFVSC
jgi:hypothetical protein